MFEFIEQHRTRLAELCRHYGVSRLELFGSVASDSFDPERSDLDFVVEFVAGYDLAPWMGRYFELQDALQHRFGRRVDLVMAGAIRNPYFRREVDRTRRTLYAA